MPGNGVENGIRRLGNAEVPRRDAAGGPPAIQGLALMEKIFHGLPRRDGKPAIRLAGNTLQNDGERDIEEAHRAAGSQMPAGSAGRRAP